MSNIPIDLNYLELGNTHTMDLCKTWRGPEEKISRKPRTHLQLRNHINNKLKSARSRPQTIGIEDKIDWAATIDSSMAKYAVGFEAVSLAVLNMMNSEYEGYRKVSSNYRFSWRSYTPSSLLNSLLST
jgi:hypothetical protein